jgi:transcriptional regulator with GAF, ATPase, and Fis domain
MVTPAETPAGQSIVVEILKALQGSPDLAASLTAVVKDAAACYGTPMAMITFSDESTVTFAIQHGLQVDVVRSNSEHAFLGQAVKRRLPTVVLDSHADRRFSQDRLVTGLCGGKRRTNETALDSWG